MLAMIFISLGIQLELGAMGFWFNKSTSFWGLPLVFFITLLAYVRRGLKYGWTRYGWTEMLTFTGCFLIIGLQMELFVKPHLEKHGIITRGIVDKIGVYVKGNIDVHSSFVFEGKRYFTTGAFSNGTKFGLGDTVQIKFSPVHPLISKIL